MSPPAPRRPDDDETPVLPDLTRDESDEGWGQDEEYRRDRGWYERERPPHHD